MVKDSVHRLHWLFPLLLLGITLTGCMAPGRPPLNTPPAKEISIPEEQRPIMPDDPRERASMGLTEQGRKLLENGRVDEAIGLFERAMNISPSNGYNYFYLAEIWILKGDVYQAREWNGLAEIYLRENGIWMDKVLEQRKRIRKGMR